MSTSNRQVELEGRGNLILTPGTHLATGGEAEVHAVGDLAIKVYLDARKMERDGMVDKVALLRPFSSDVIVAPEGVVRDKRSGAPVGFYSRLVEGEPLPRVFTSAFWQRTPFTTAQASLLVARMREAVVAAHAGGAVMVDANELNWLVSTPVDPRPHVIDVDSWAIGRFSAKVIMQSIRDFHSKVFDARSDWFAFAVVTFQIYTGIHPYRGTLDGYKPSEWEKRMRDNASVFTKGVRLASAVRPVNNIPPALRAWYEAVFQHGERTAAPVPGAAPASPPASAAVSHHETQPSSGGALVLDKIFDLHPVRRVWPCGAILVEHGPHLEVWDAARKRILFGSARTSRDCEVIRAPGGWVLAEPGRPYPLFTYLADDGSVVPLDLKLAARQIFRSENRLFLVTDGGLIELELFMMAKPVLAVRQTVPILHPRSTRWFDGVGVERAFAATFVVTPMRGSACATVRVPELDGLHVVSAKAGKRFAAFVGEDRTGSLRKVELSFDENHTSYKVWQGATDSADLNLAVLPKGVAATIVRDGELCVFVPTSGASVVTRDAAVLASSTLATIDDAVVWTTSRGDLWSVKMK